MKRQFVNLTGPAAVLPALLLGLFLPAGTRAQTNSCNGSAQVSAQAQEHGRDQRVWLRIFAFTDAPVVGADVRVTLHGRVLVDAKAATNKRGGFPARVWRPWLLDEEAAGDANAPERDRHRRRSFVRISVSGGTLNGDPFLGHLSADVAITDLGHQILVVNPVSTLVSRLLEERPVLKLDEAEALVRRFLKLPANYSLGLALGKSSHYVSPFFSPVAFMTEASDAGGLDAFEHLLLQELASPSATHSFRNTKALGSTDSSAISVFQAGLYAGLLDIAGAEGVGSLAGWALSYTGLATPGATDDDINALQDALDGLGQEVDNLQTQVGQLSNLVLSKATQTQYDLITLTAQTLANDVCDEVNRLYNLTIDCPPLPDGSTPTQPAPDSFCATEPVAIRNDLNGTTLYSAYTNIESYVKDNGLLGTEGMLHLYSLWLGQSKQFFRAADSTKMQNLYDYWNGVLTQAAELKVELLHQEGEQAVGGANLIALMGNPDATPPTTGVFQANQAANLKLMFPPVPTDPAFPQNGGVVINTQDHAMWALAPWVATGPYKPPALASPQPSCSTWPSPLLGVPNVLNASPLPYLGFSNWATSPSKAQWQAAVSLAPTNGSVLWRDWLTQQTQTTDDEMPPSSGFFVWASHCSSAIPGGAWTSTFDHVANNFVYWYWYINPSSNTFATAGSSSLGNGTNVSGGTNLFDIPVRTLAAGEQYFWYQ